MFYTYIKIVEEWKKLKQVNNNQLECHGWHSAVLRSRIKMYLLCVHTCVPMRESMWNLEENLQELVLLFPHGSLATRVARLCSGGFATGDLSGPETGFFLTEFWWRKSTFCHLSRISVDGSDDLGCPLCLDIMTTLCPSSQLQLLCGKMSCFLGNCSSIP